MEIEIPALINRIKKAKQSKEFANNNERLTFLRAFSTKVGSRDTIPTRYKLLKSLKKPSRILPGMMLFYQYDPKYKDTLPQWDQFPLVIVLDLYEDGFLGLNLHFAPPQIRQKIFIAFLTSAKTAGRSETKRLQVDYDIARSLIATKFMGPMIKRYLYSQFIVPPKQVPYSMWEDILFLPLGQIHSNG